MPDREKKLIADIVERAGKMREQANKDRENQDTGLILARPEALTDNEIEIIDQEEASINTESETE